MRVTHWQKVDLYLQLERIKTQVIICITNFGLTESSMFVTVYTHTVDIQCIIHMYNPMYQQLTKMCSTL